MDAEGFYRDQITVGEHQVRIALRRAASANMVAQREDVMVDPSALP
jgi:hypothetical protein